MFHKGNGKWVLLLLLALSLVLAACQMSPEEAAKKACADSGMQWKTESGVIKCVPNTTGAPPQTGNNTSAQTQGNTSTQGANTSTQGANTSTQGANTSTQAQTGTGTDPWGLYTMSLGDAQKWLSQNVGGKPEKWTWRNDTHTVFGYWDPDVKTTFKHPGQNSMLTYWKDFPEATNARGCWQQIPAKDLPRWDGTTRSLQCPSSGATFTADGVGFHPIAPSN